MRARLIRSGGLRLVTPLPPRRDLTELARMIRETPLDKRARGIACAIAEELFETSDERSPTFRVEAALHVSLLVDDEHWVGMTETLDTRSVFVKTYLTKEVGSELEIAIELPNAHVLRATGVVAGIRPERRGAAALPGMNVRFVTMSSLDEKRLADYVDVVSGRFWSSPPPSMLDA